MNTAVKNTISFFLSLFLNRTNKKYKKLNTDVTNQLVNRKSFTEKIGTSKLNRETKMNVKINSFILLVLLYCENNFSSIFK